MAAFDMIIDLCFSGDTADQNRLPGLAGSISIEGMSRSLNIISHYAATGIVRHRFPFSADFDLDIVSFDEGSFNVRLDLRFAVTAAAWIVSAGVAGSIGNFTTDFIKSTYNNLLGSTIPNETEQVRRLKEARPGDMEALHEAATPSAQRAHTVIGNGARNLIVNGNNNRIVLLDEASKDYLNSTSIDRNLHAKLVSVGMLNVNSRNGRVFDYELGKLVSIYVSGNCTSRTMANLARSLQLYASRQDSSMLQIRYRKRDKAGQPDKYFIEDAWFE